jgi:glutamine amidotransferase
MNNIAVIDYGGSNLRSVARALDVVSNKGDRIIITSDKKLVRNASKVVFPGQGAIGNCMNHLYRMELIDIIKEAAFNVPFLGICLGLQSLLTLSEEDEGTLGLDLLPGRVRRFPLKAGFASDGNRMKIPHMGWNTVQWKRRHPLLSEIPPGARFYFVHSYYVELEDDNAAIGDTDYIVPFTSAATKGNVFATQFHPEKSAQNGLKLLRNFLLWDGER